MGWKEYETGARGRMDGVTLGLILAGCAAFWAGLAYGLGLL